MCLYEYILGTHGEIFSFWVSVHTLINLSLDGLTSCAAVHSQLTSESEILLCWRENRIFTINPQFSGGCCLSVFVGASATEHNSGFVNLPVVKLCVYWQLVFLWETDLTVSLRGVQSQAEAKVSLWKCIQWDWRHLKLFISSYSWIFFLMWCCPKAGIHCNNNWEALILY